MNLSNALRKLWIWTWATALLATPVLAQGFEQETMSPTYELADDMLEPDPSRGLQSGTPWTNGIVPYTFSSNVSATQRQLMLDAMRQWEYVAGIVFVQRTSQPNYLFIRNVNDPNICGSSYVGMIGGSQNLNMVCWTNRTMLHELGHALGLRHEHQRSDRDNFITINYNNIPPSRWHNFDIAAGSLLSNYDFLSIMHYHQYAFAITGGQPTIIAKPGFEQYQDVMGTVQYLSLWDGSSMRQTYGISDWGPLVSGPGYLLFETVEGQPVPDQSFQVWSNGLGPIPYYFAGASSWVSLTPTQGSATSSPNTHQVSVDVSAQAVGSYASIISVRRALDHWNASTLAVELRVYVNIPDPSFKTYLVNQFDSDQNGEISKDEAQAVTIIDCSGLGITDLTGLAHFENLTYLDASDNFIIDMQPIWDNPNLTQDPNCSHHIDISNNALNTNPGQGYCWLHCMPIGYVDTANQSGSANPLYCRCYDSTCTASE